MPSLVQMEKPGFVGGRTYVHTDRQTDIKTGFIRQTQIKGVNKSHVTDTRSHSEQATNHTSQTLDHTLNKQQITRHRH